MNSSPTPPDPGARTGDGPGAQDAALRASAETVAALADLAELVAAGVSGCDGASVSLLVGGQPSTLAASHAYVRLLDDVQYARGAGPCVQAMQGGLEVGVADYSAELRWPEVVRDLRAAGVRSSLSLPLVEGGTVLGGLNMYGVEVEAFGGRSEVAAHAFARHAVVILGYLRDLHVERAARLREREVSAALQRSLLPALPVLPGLTTAARYLVGAEHAQVGGDWYDVFALPDGAVGIAVGDVMGHDLAAAAAMGQLRSVLRSYAYDGRDPADVLSRLDQLVQGFDMAQLATVVYGRLERGRLVFASAGHLPPVVRLADGTTTVLRQEAAPLIGATAPGQAVRPLGEIDLPPGALLVLYTDGLVETRTDDLDDRIDELARRLAHVPRGSSPDDVCDALLDGLCRSGAEDDTALLVVAVD